MRVEIEFTLRQMAPSDINNLKQVIDRSFPRFFRFFASQSLHTEGQVFLSEIQGKAVGFVKLIDLHVGSDKFGCILWLAVHPQYRRKGIADALIKTGTERLMQESAKAVFSSVQGRNLASLTVFSKSGFEKMGFLDLWKLFSWRVFKFYDDIWYAPGEIVLMHK
jgi:ribosomal protein S18 acetylase RimI-like enzyme